MTAAPVSPVELNALVAGVWPVTAYKNAAGVLSVGGMEMVELAERFGTPAYVLDEADFRYRCAQFREAFAEFDIYYAGKAFLCKAVARLVAQEGLSLDVCSPVELTVALAAGFPPERIVLHGNNKSVPELTRAVECGVGRIVVDSFDELDRLTALARRTGARPAVLLRATVGVTSDAHAHNATAHEDQKFGFTVSTGSAADALRRVVEDGVLDLRGLHIHIGSQIFDTSGFEVGARRALALRSAVAAEHDLIMPELSLGGGFGIAYTADDSPATPRELAHRLLSAVAEECAALGLPVPRLAIEPGRAIVGTAGCTVYRVGTVKRIDGIRTYVAVDGGMSDNVRPALFGAVYSVALANRASTAPPMLARVVGKHCDAGDIVVHSAYLPEDVRPGDLLAVAATGAYCRSLSSNFNHTPRPPVIAVADGKARVIVRAETEEDLLSLDVG